MEVLADLAAFLDEHTETGRRYGLAQLLEEFRKALVDELDYRREADNLSRMRELVADHDLIVVPEPFPDLTTSRVLTMEFVAGKKVTDLGALARLELDGAPLADQLFAAYLDQVLVAGRLPRRPAPRQRAGDARRAPRPARHRHDRTARPRRPRPAGQALPGPGRRPARGGHPDRVTLGERLPDFDETVFARTVADLVGRSADASLSDLDIGALVLQLTRKAGEAGLRMDPELVMLGKTLLNLDQVAATLDPGFEPREALQRHMADLMKSSMRTTPAAMMASLLEAKEFVEELPGRVNRAFDAVGQGNFELRIKAFDEDEFLRGLHKLANVLAAAVVLASMILASALLAQPSGQGASVENHVALVVFVVAVSCPSACWPGSRCRAGASEPIAPASSPPGFSRRSSTRLPTCPSASASLSSTGRTWLVCSVL